MNAGDVATQLDKRIAAALNATAGTSGHCAARWNASMKFTTCSRPVCLPRNDRGGIRGEGSRLLDILGDFEGLIAELADA